MLGRQNKELILRLLKVTHDPTYHIIVTRSRSKGTSRLDRIGSISPRATISMLKLDYKKLNKYLIEKNVAMTPAVAKALNLDVMHILDFKAYLKQKNAIQRLTGATLSQARIPPVCAKCENLKTKIVTAITGKLLEKSKNRKIKIKKKIIVIKPKRDAKRFKKKIKNNLKRIRLWYNVKLARELEKNLGQILKKIIAFRYLYPRIVKLSETKTMSAALNLLDNYEKYLIETSKRSRANRKRVLLQKERVKFNKFLKTPKARLHRKNLMKKYQKLLEKKPNYVKNLQED